MKPWASELLSSEAEGEEGKVGRAFSFFLGDGPFNGGFGDGGCGLESALFSTVWPGNGTPGLAELVLAAGPAHRSVSEKQFGLSNFHQFKPSTGLGHSTWELVRLAAVPTSPSYSLGTLAGHDRIHKQACQQHGAAEALGLISDRLAEFWLQSNCVCDTWTITRQVAGVSGLHPRQWNTASRGGRRWNCRWQGRVRILPWQGDVCLLRL